MEWLTVRDVAAHSVAELDQALSTTGPGAARLPNSTVTSDMVAKVTIVPLALVHPLPRSPFLIPANVWNLIAARAASMGLERRVAPFLQWLRAQTTRQEAAIKALIRVDLADSTLQARQDLKNKLIPPLPPPVATAAPPPAKPAMGAADRWDDGMRSLLRLCNVTAAADLPPI